MRLERSAQLVRILQTGLDAGGSALVAELGNVPAGTLRTAWAEFIALPTTDQVEALESNDFRGVPWQSLLQCNPYSRLAGWEQIQLRAYE